jgi:hypothetical protein
MLQIMLSSHASRVVAFVGCLMLPALASAQQPLQFNVPYRCQDGVTRIITRCEKNARGGEVCFWREEQNGQLITERYNVRGQMDGWLATCKAPPAQPAATPGPAPQSAAPAAPPDRPGQPLNPAYLAGMPSPDVVRQRIQGSNAVDTVARQVAVLNRLPRLIERMRMAPDRKFALTSDEQQMVNAYNLASYQLSQAYSKSAAPEAVKNLQQVVARYEDDPALNDQMMGLLSSASLADYRRVDRGASERAQARIDQQQREAEAARTLLATPAAGRASKIPNDPGTVAMRRCLELGGGTAECLGSGLQTGLIDLVGFSKHPLAEVFLNGVNPSGVRIGGTFAAAGGLTIEFTNQAANISKCGKLEPASREYTVTNRGGQLQVEISNEPKPLVVLLGPNNVFTGPAAFPITGQLITGYRSVYVEQRRVIDNLPVPGSGHYEQVPIYETRTLSCGFASLHDPAPTRADGSVIGAVSGIFTGKPDPSSELSGTTEAPAGPRMGGTYAGPSGFKVEFQPTAVVLDCGNAHVKRPYGVQSLADRVVVTVRNGNVPVTLTLGPDGALVGSGWVDVVGRLVTGINASNVTFAPHQERCAVGTLTAR